MSEKGKQPGKPERPPEFKTEPIRRDDRSREFSHSDMPKPRDKPEKRG